VSDPSTGPPRVGGTGGDHRFGRLSPLVEGRWPSDRFRRRGRNSASFGDGDRVDPHDAEYVIHLNALERPP
jgi:hypothetical protein